MAGTQLGIIVHSIHSGRCNETTREKWIEMNIALKPHCN